MAEGDEAVIRRAIDLFNRMLDPDARERDREEAERVWVEEPEIVPMRAALEGNVYRGADAIERFREDSLESWSELHLEIEEISATGRGYLVTADLRGRGRESGAEVTTTIWFAIELREGRVARGAAHFARGDALADLAD